MKIPLPEASLASIPSSPVSLKRTKSLWHQEAHTAGAKTLNEYLSAANTFITRLKRSNRLSLENPLQYVEKISTVGQETYERRPFTDKELRCLIAVSAYRSVVYLTAAHTGLRRKELRTLVWADVFLDFPPSAYCRADQERQEPEAAASRFTRKS